jgi:hypothetical protein
LPELGRDITGDLDLSESREWLCANGIGGFAMGTVAGSLARRYHGLLVAAISPPLGRVLMVAKLEEIVSYDGRRWELGANRWSGGTVAPAGQRFLEGFRLENGVPVWGYACADALLEKRVWMEQGANTTYASYRVVRATGPVQLEVKALVNYRDYHATTRAEGWRIRVEAAPAGLVIHAFDGARPLTLVAAGATAEMQNEWYRGYELLRETPPITRARCGAGCSAPSRSRTSRFTAIARPRSPCSSRSADTSAPTASAAWGRFSTRKRPTRRAAVRSRPGRWPRRSAPGQSSRGVPLGGDRGKIPSWNGRPRAPRCASWPRRQHRGR